MSTLTSGLLLPILLVPSAPVPKDRKVPTIRTVAVDPPRPGRSLVPGPLMTPAEFDKRGPDYPELKAYATTEELLKQFRDADALKAQLAEKFDSGRHVILFARWYSWSHRDDLRLQVPVDGDGKVLFRHDCHRPQPDCIRVPRFEHNVVFVIDKGLKWRVGTEFHDK